MTSAERREATECPNTLEDSDIPCGDEGRACEDCQNASALYWSKVFGLDGLTGEARRNQLDQFRPYVLPSEVES